MENCFYLKQQLVEHVLDFLCFGQQPLFFQSLRADYRNNTTEKALDLSRAFSLLRTFTDYQMVAAQGLEPRT